MEQEVWKPVMGYEGLYEISNTGVVRSIKRASGKYSGDYLNNSVRVAKMNKGGYLFNAMYKNGKQKSKYIHRMVAEAFIANIENKKEVNHIDGDKTNNFVSNLEWVTYSENKLHAYDNGLNHSGNKHHKTKIKDEDIQFILTSNLNGVELSNLFKVHPSTISLIRLGKNRKRAINKIKTI